AATQVVKAVLVGELDAAGPRRRDERAGLQQALRVVGVVADLQPRQGDPRGIELRVPEQLRGEPSTHEATLAWLHLEQRPRAEVDPDPALQLSASTPQHGEAARALDPAEAR